MVGLAGVRNVPAQRAGTLGPCAHAQSPDGRATLPRSLAFPPIPHVWLRPPAFCTKSTPPFSGRGAFGWAGRGQECSCPEGRNIGALRSRAKPGWARNAPPEPCFSAHPPRLASTPAFIRKAPLPFQGEVLLVGLAGVEPTMWESKSHALPLGDSPI